MLTTTKSIGKIFSLALFLSATKTGWSQPTPANPIDPPDTIGVNIFAGNESFGPIAPFSGTPATFNKTLSSDGVTASVNATSTTSLPNADMLSFAHISVTGPHSPGGLANFQWNASLEGTVGYSIIVVGSPTFTSNDEDGALATFQGGGGVAHIGSLIVDRGTISSQALLTLGAIVPSTGGDPDEVGDATITAFWKLFKIPPPSPPPPPDDIDGDGIVDGGDATFLQASIHAGLFDPDLDYNNNQVLDEQDLAIFLSVTGSSFGDANFDGNVNQDDLAIIDQNWQQPGFWSEGDFNWDLVVDVLDYQILLDNCLSAADACFLAGDANNDGAVTGGDLISVFQNFGNVGQAGGSLLGDANGDGLVTGADQISVQQNFGSALGSGSAPTSTPEPTSAALLGLGGLFVLRHRNVCS